MRILISNLTSRRCRKRIPPPTTAIVKLRSRSWWSSIQSASRAKALSSWILKDRNFHKITPTFWCTCVLKWASSNKVFLSQSTKTPQVVIQRRQCWKPLANSSKTWRSEIYWKNSVSYRDLRCISTTPRIWWPCRYLTSNRKIDTIPSCPLAIIRSN